MWKRQAQIGVENEGLQGSEQEGRERDSNEMSVEDG